MFNTMIKGSFSVQVIRRGKVIKSLPRTDNLITRGGMDFIGGIGNYLHVGTGAATPVFNDVNLDSYLAGSSIFSWVDNTSVLTGTNYLKESQNTFSFSIGAVVGNISELGLSGGTASSAGIKTRALFKDGAGDPTTITVTAQDQLVVTYFIQKTISMIPFSSSILADIDGIPTTLNYTVRPCISSLGDTGSNSEIQSSIYQQGSGENLYMFVNSTNIVSIDPVTYIPTLIDSGGDSSTTQSHSVALTSTGNEVTHSMTMPINRGNFEWRAITISTVDANSSSYTLFQIEFDGPNYITKANTDQVTFKIKETMNQVIVP